MYASFQNNSPVLLQRREVVTSHCHGTMYIAKVLDNNKPEKVTQKSIRTSSNFTDLIQFH